jgi:hypothetical protein
MERDRGKGRSGDLKIRGIGEKGIGESILNMEG